MDLAKRLADWRDQPPEQWLGTANRYLPPAVTAVLVITIAYQLAQLTWALAPGATSAVAPPPRLAESAGTTTDFGVLTSSHLFGEASGQPTAALPAALDAPETTLSLTLKGILSDDRDPNKIGAVISSNRGEDKNYRVGQAIEGADGATLHSVYADRVLLNRNGTLETLRLPKELATQASGLMFAPPLPQASQANPTLREAIADNASRITDILRAQPHIQDGQVIGFRLNPGRDRATFEALGLQANDVVTEINGTVLDDPSQGLQVYESLGEATQANVTILRDGVPQVVVIDTSQIQSLQENRQ